MYTFEVWVRLNAYQTVHVRMQAGNAIECKMIAEAQYGQGNVLNYRQLSEGCV
jgi:hypothetical protein